MKTKKNIEEESEESKDNKKIKVENTPTFKFGLDKSDNVKNNKIVKSSTFTLGNIEEKEKNEEKEDNEEKEENEDNEDNEDSICPECLGEKNECSQLCGRCMRLLTMKSLNW